MPRSFHACLSLLTALAAAGCAQAHFISVASQSQVDLAGSASLVHDGGIVFAKGYPAPRLENPNLVPVFAGGSLDAAAARSVVTLTNGQKTGWLPAPGRATVGVQAQRFGLLDVATSQKGTGAGSPTDEARYQAGTASANPDVPFFARRASTTAKYTLAALPNAVDMRVLMPPVRDQGERNTGVAMAASAILDYMAARDPHLTIKQASPQFLNWRYQIEVKSKLDLDERSQVWRSRDTIASLFYALLHLDGNPTPSADAPYVPPLRGYIGESQCPYQPEQLGLVASTNVLDAARALLGDGLTQQVADHAPLLSQGAYFYRIKTDVATYKAALAGGQPIQLSVPVYIPDWASPSAAKGYHLAEMDETKAKDTANLAYQSVVLVGYEKDAAAAGGGWFILRNSWGTGWADGGYARISFQSVMDFGYAAHIAVAYATPYEGSYDVFPPPNSPQEDANAGRRLPPITDTEAWGSYTDVSLAKEGANINTLPLPPVATNDLGLPVAQGDEGNAYLQDGSGIGNPQPGENGAVLPLDVVPGLETTPAPVPSVAAPAPLVVVPASVAPVVEPSAAAASADPAASP